MVQYVLINCRVDCRFQETQLTNSSSWNTSQTRTDIGNFTLRLRQVLWKRSLGCLYTLQPSQRTNRIATRNQRAPFIAQEFTHDELRPNPDVSSAWSWIVAWSEESCSGIQENGVYGEWWTRKFEHQMNSTVGRSRWSSKTCSGLWSSSVLFHLAWWFFLPGATILPVGLFFCQDLRYSGLL